MAPDLWHSRGYLPHFDAPQAIQSITYRLSDSLPAHAVQQRLAYHDSLPAHEQEVERRRRIEAWMDAGHGSCILRDPTAAQLVIESWQQFDGDRYRLLAWVVMPNHIHVLMELTGKTPLARIVQSWKSFTGRA